MRIEYLADHVSHLPRLAQWHFAEFGYLNPANTLDRYVERLTAALQKSDLPTTFIALDGDSLLGSASLVRRTITHPHLSPWLSSVYVDPPHRGRGIASALVGRVERAAAGMSLDRIYLFTPSSEKLYAGLGWELIEYSHHHDLKIAIMSKGLAR
ncbi:MAG: GNAT family N-acetyltransferase [Bradyrhizobium sp.]|uniref:GNAT family N-acetyltransferase n=1 Tax=Bradyrhizobium sp. TaxID=376 RepID=UPI00271D4BAA|nr:GNAT family N-acetyltransferase [Bradyrhizobium sp.]MDO9564574.1 GNAT family N-acetyltransferase [Bradyrhizobium sp.]MDP3691877.1 GNAT family N-acetyltransferase [Bradyrhizobium sp.]